MAGTEIGATETRSRAAQARCASRLERVARDAPEGPAQPARKQRTGFRQFVRECIAELRKVQWPTRRQLWQASGVVIVVCIVLGVYIAPSIPCSLASRLADRPVRCPLIMFHWYVINTYSGHENKVRQNLLHRVESMSQQQKIRRVVVPTEQVVETKDGQKIQVEKRTLPGYVLVHMELTTTPGTSSRTPRASPASSAASDTAPTSARPRSPRARSTGSCTSPRSAKPQPDRAEFSLGETVKVISGPLADFDGEIIEVNAEAGRLKVAVSIFERRSRSTSRSTRSRRSTSATSSRRVTRAAPRGSPPGRLTTPKEGTWPRRS